MSDGTVWSEEPAHESTVEELCSEWARELSERRIEGLLDESLHPRGPGMLFDMAASVGLSANDLVLDAGCRDGRDSLWGVYQMIGKLAARVYVLA